MSRLTRDSRSLEQRLQIEIARLRRQTSSVSVSGSVLAETVRHIVYVTDYAGVAVTGATVVATLHSDDGATYAAASETPTVIEVSAGEYRITYTPTLRGALYRLRLSATGLIVTPAEFQDVAW